MQFLRTRRNSPRYKWWVLTCTSLGMLLATINQGTLVIALPDLERSLHTSLLQLVWVMLVYMIVTTVCVLSAGRLGDLFGHKRSYVAGFTVFALTSLGAGFASSGTELIFWRIFQGLGAAALFAVPAALVAHAFPRRELGLAMGSNTMVGAVGLVVGPVLGGGLVSISWPWVFWFNVPLAAVGAVWALLVLDEREERSADRGIDLPGTLAYVVGLTGLVYALSRGALSGWADATVFTGFAAAAVFLPLFLVVEHRSPEPMLDLSLFRDRVFSAAGAAQLLNSLGRAALTFLFVFYFQGPQERSPIMAGLMLAPMAAGMLVASPLAGRYADRHGARGLASAGLLVGAAGTAGMTMLGAHTAYWVAAIWLALAGIGSGMFMSPNGAAMMGAVPARRRGIAAGARIMLLNTGSVMSIAFLLAIITHSLSKTVLFKIFSGLTSGVPARSLAPFSANMHTALWALTAVSLVGAAVSALRPSHRAATADSAQPATEAA